MTTSQKIYLGRLGEKIVAKILEKKGIKVLKKNFKSKFGEIDLIGQKEKTLIFFEVKTRKTLKFGKPYEAVNKSKLKKIQKTISYFLSKNPKYKDFSLRIDIISLILKKKNEIKEFKHFENVLVE